MDIDLQILLTRQMQLDPQAFAGQLILITGAGRGIGYHTARVLTHLGGKVILPEISDQGCDAERIVREGGGDAHFFQTDNSDPESVSNLTVDIK